MAYQAQINIKTTGLSGLNKINASVDRINKAIISINKGGSKIKAGKELVKTSQQDLGIKQKILKVETDIANQLQRQKTLRGKTGGKGGTSTGTKGTVAGGGGGGGILSGALISGAFPVLFGGGLAGGAAGFGGGLIGGALGGQTGGFAGGLVATAALQATTALGELGQALNPLTADVTRLTSAVGLAGTQEELRLRAIEELEGKQAALAAATASMADVIGETGVDALRTFGENFTAISNNFARFGLQLQTNFAKLFNRIIELFPALKGSGGSSPTVNKTVEERLKTEPEAKKLNKKITELKDEIVKLEEAMTKQQNAFIPKELGFLRGGSSLFPSQIDTKAIEKETNTQAKITDKKGKLAEEEKRLKILEELFTKEGQIRERKAAAVKQQEAALKTTKKEIELLQGKLDGNLEEVQIRQRVDQIEQNLLDKGILRRDIDRDNIQSLVEKEFSMKKQVDTAEKLNQAFKSMGDTIKNDIKQGIKGLIQGTSTLSDLLNNVADRFLDLAIDQMFDGGPLGGGGIFGFLGGLFKAKGGPVTGGNPYIVGEKGPELFVPGSSGNIVPNNKLGGSGGGSGVGGTNIVVNVDASGSNVEGDEEEGRELGRMIAVAIQSEIIKQKRPGGLL